MNSISNYKNNFKIYIYSIKRNFFPILFFLFLISLILFSKTNLIAAQTGLTLWATAVIPSLFPFFVATELFSYTNIIGFFKKFLTPIMRPLFNIPGEAAFAFLMGLISGYPVGAKVVSDLKEREICTKDEAERMLAFTNNSGPLFIIGTVGISLFGNTLIGILLFITHVLSCITVGILLRFCSFNKSKTQNVFNNNLQKNKIKQITFSSLGEILGKSITNSISIILMIGGFIVIFSVIISILNQSQLLNIFSLIFSPILSLFNIPTEFCKPLLSGIIELTNGVSLTANINLKIINTNIILCAFLLGFGGFSVLLQVFSIISKSGLSIKTYIVGKILQGFIAAFYTFIAIQTLPFLQFNL